MEKKNFTYLILLIWSAFLSGCDAANSTKVEKIYFWSDRDGQKQIYSMNSDGSDQQRISNLPNWDFNYSRLSPNQKYLAVVREQNRRYSIFVLTLDGTVVGKSSNFDTSDDSPSWSPDSTHIAFASSRDGHGAIYTMKLDGSEIKRLTNIDGQLQTCPVWSPDGKKITFQSSEKTMVFENYVINTDGTNIINFGRSTSGSGYYCPPVSWSPNSNSVSMFGTTIVGFPEQAPGWNKYYSIQVVSPDVTLGNCTQTPPIWSHDGKRLMFFSDLCRHDFRYDIYVVNIDGTMLMNLTNNSSNNSNPIWSSDDKSIVFESDKTGNFEIFRIDSDGTDLVQLTNNLSVDIPIDWK